MSEALPIEGKCNARLRGKRAGELCTADPVKGRTRCGDHGGKSPRAEEHPRFKHGATSRGGDGLEVFTKPFSEAERAEQDRAEQDVAGSLKRNIGELDVFMRRAARKGNVELFRQLSIVKASLVRAHAALQELPSPDQVGPDIVEMYRATTAEQIQRGPYMVERLPA